MTPATLLPTLARAFIDIGEATLVGVSLSLSLFGVRRHFRGTPGDRPIRRNAEAHLRERDLNVPEARARAHSLSLSLSPDFVETLCASRRAARLASADGRNSKSLRDRTVAIPGEVGGEERLHTRTRAFT